MYNKIQFYCTFSKSEKIELKKSNSKLFKNKNVNSEKVFLIYLDKELPYFFDSLNFQVQAFGKPGVTFKKISKIKPI